LTDKAIRLQSKNGLAARPAAGSCWSGTWTCAPVAANG
jgi:hypothetical protein